MKNDLIELFLHLYRQYYGTTDGLSYIELSRLSDEQIKQVIRDYDFLLKL